VKFVRLPRHVKSIHYAWVMLGIAIAMRLVSSVERTASLLGFLGMFAQFCCCLLLESCQRVVIEHSMFALEFPANFSTLPNRGSLF